MEGRGAEGKFVGCFSSEFFPHCDSRGFLAVKKDDIRAI